MVKIKLSLTNCGILFSKMENIDLPSASDGADTQPQINTQENITPPAQTSTSFFAKLKTNWPIMLGALGSVAIFAAIIYAAYSNSKHKQEVVSAPTVVSLPEPVLTIAPLKTPASTSTSPVVSDKGEIVFVRDEEVWTINLDGSSERQIPEADAKQHKDYLWSPNGDKIATQITDNNGVSTHILDTSGNLLFKADAASIYLNDGDRLKGSFVFPIGWFNDNESLLVHYEPGMMAGSLREEALFRLKPDRTCQEIATGKFDEINISPKSNKILYVRGKKVQNIWTVNSDGSDNRQLTSHTDNFPEMLFYQTNGIPKFSPDESKILAALSSSGTPPDTTGAIVIIDIHTGKEESLLPYFGLRGFNWINNTEIIFSSIRTDGSYIADLWKLNIETLEKQKLTTNASQPVWSPL